MSLRPPMAEGKRAIAVERQWLDLLSELSIEGCFTFSWPASRGGVTDNGLVDNGRVVFARSKVPQLLPVSA